MLKPRLYRLDLETAEALVMKGVENMLPNQAFVSPSPHDIENLTTVENDSEICCALAASSMGWIHLARNLLQIHTFIPVGPKLFVRLGLFETPKAQM